MSIEKIEMTNFRNHKDFLVDFSPGINIIWGENGSGKTSILEAVYLASNGKSFKTNRLSETIKTGANETTVKALFSDHKITIHQNKRALKKIKINNTDKKTKDLIGKNPTVLVSPEEEKITKGPHLERRKYFNRLFATVSKKYLSNLVNYSAAIKNRNSLLKQKKTKTEIEIWNEPVAKYGSLVWLEKQQLEKTFNSELAAVCNRHSNDITINIKPDTPTDKTKETLLQQLQNTINKEIVVGRTLCGPHCDKYNILFNNKRLRVFGSQGEHKLSFVIIKITEHSFIKTETGKSATLLLDDLFAKLDLERGSAIFDLIKKSSQTIITNTDLISAEKHGIDTNNPNNQTTHLKRNWKN